MTTAAAAVMEPEAREGEVPALSIARRAKLRPIAMAFVIAATVFAGVVIALQVPFLAPYPGTAGDPIMRTLSYVAVNILIITAFKVVEVKAVGRWLEGLVGYHRRVRLRDAFHPCIRRTAMIGGVFNAIYSILFVAMVPILAPVALTSARACVVIALLVVELTMGLLTFNGKTPYRKLVLSVAVTLLGAAIVIFSGGFKLFEGQSQVYLWLFVALIGPANFLLAFAEAAEMKGVQKVKVSAATYTLARYVYYLATCLVALVAWAVISHGWGMFWAVAHMCVARWYLLIPIAIFASATDLVRICAKTVVPATFMYVVGALSVAIDAITQTVAKALLPGVYVHVHGGLVTAVFAIGGGLVIWYAVKCFPHPRAEAEVIPPSRAPPAS